MLQKFILKISRPCNQDWPYTIFDDLSLSQRLIIAYLYDFSNAYCLCLDRFVQFQHMIHVIAASDNENKYAA